jgi:hypothetical protein
VASADGTYQLRTVRGANLPVSLFPQCSLGNSQPCAASGESAASGTLTLKSTGLSTGTLSGSAISTSFNWINPDPGGQPLAVTATFNK